MSVQNHSYVSNAELLTWVAEKNGGLHDDMRKQMDMANERRAMVKDLSDLGAHLKAMKELGNHGARAEEIRAFLTKYEGSENYAELESMLRPMIAKLDPQPQTDAANVPHTSIPEFGGPGGFPGVGPGSLPREFLLPSKEQVDAWTSEIQSTVDSLNKQDEFALIQIQDTHAQAKQAMELASNLIASKNQSHMNAIGNIRG